MIEEKESLMVSPTGGDPFHKKAYFLKPIAPNSTIDEPPFQLSQCLSSPQSRFDPHNLVLEVHGWHFNHQDLQTWVHHLAPTHQSTWRKAGIYEAIFNSIYEIKKQKDLLCGFAEKWCSETNTFVFAWGEATITLEDAMVLGGFSVLGDSILSPLKSRELKEIEAKLEKERRGLYNHKAGISIASTKVWMKKFMKSGSELEHEAFLVFWLSRYVFHNSRNLVNKAVISIAIHLARGTRIALAPAVLAHIYRDLSLLKRTIIASSELNDRNHVMKLVLRSPFQLVQVWIWERFLELRPKHNAINYVEPRLARWHKLDILNVKHLWKVLDSAGEGFMWRPYALAINNLNFLKYYVEEEKWVSVGPTLDDELLAFVMCLRVTELVGFGTKQQYLPHRVAMQFGYDQDIPGFVDPSNCYSNATWNQHLKEFENVRLYIPSRLSEADASMRYLKWWKESVKGLNHRSLSLEMKAREVQEGICDATAPRNSEESIQVSVQMIKGNEFPAPQFLTERYKLQVKDPLENDELTISEALKLRKKLKLVEDRKGAESEKFSGPILASSVVDESSVNIMESETLEKEVISLTWGGKGKRNLNKMKRRMVRRQGNDIVSITGCESPSTASLFEKPECDSSTLLFEKRECSNSISLFNKKLECASITSTFSERVSELRAKINRVEQVVQVLKANTFRKS